MCDPMCVNTRCLVVRSISYYRSQSGVKNHGSRVALKSVLHPSSQVTAREQRTDQGSPRHGSRSDRDLGPRRIHFSPPASTSPRGGGAPSLDAPSLLTAHCWSFSSSTNSHQRCWEDGSDSPGVRRHRLSAGGWLMTCDGW